MTQKYIEQDFDSISYLRDLVLSFYRDDKDDNVEDSMIEMMNNGRVVCRHADRVEVEEEIAMLMSCLILLAFDHDIDIGQAMTNYYLGRKEDT